MELEQAKTQITEWISAHGDARDKLLPLLHHLQSEIGFIDDALVPAIAAGLNLSRADIHGVLTFYHDFRRRPAGRHIVKLCRAESCQARGGAAIEAAASAKDRKSVVEGKSGGVRVGIGGGRIIKK